MALPDLVAWLAEHVAAWRATASMARALPGSSLQEAHGLLLRFAVPVAGDGSHRGRLAELFAGIHAVAGTARFESYTLGTVSLEAVLAQLCTPAPAGGVGVTISESQ